LVLVIDDSAETRKLYALVLELEGYVVAQARDGQDGLQQARDRVPDIIITDLAMPIMDGWETIRRLRADPRTRHIPIIACSGDGAYGWIAPRRECSSRSRVLWTCWSRR
jgi:chemosensory pili system protein ChpA (sensor histidine kinase/response regulator)